MRSSGSSLRLLADWDSWRSCSEKDKVRECKTVTSDALQERHEHEDACIEQRSSLASATPVYWFSAACSFAPASFFVLCPNILLPTWTFIGTHFFDCYIKITTHARTQFDMSKLRCLFQQQVLDRNQSVPISKRDPSCE